VKLSYQRHLNWAVGGGFIVRMPAVNALNDSDKLRN
jgi:hypothetical protein